MGSGKGRVRRSQATGLSSGTSVVPAVSFQWEKWTKFVRAGDLGKVRLYEYYLGKKYTNGVYSYAEHEKVITELFADSVSVGAFTLPSSYKAEDFLFAMDPDNITRYVQVTVAPHKFVLVKSPYYVGAGDCMADREIDVFLNILSIELERNLVTP